MMTIDHVGRACFIVTSHGDRWSVDLLRFKGVGQCDCWKFKQDLKEVKEGTRKISECGCPHIEFADAYLLRLFKKDLAEKYPDTEDVT